jgi:hypothetical protein
VKPQKTSPDYHTFRGTINIFLCVHRYRVFSDFVSVSGINS